MRGGLTAGYGGGMNPLWPAAGPAATCSTCTWRFEGGRGRSVSRCRRHGDARIAPEADACPAYTVDLDCIACGACCREAFDAVEISPRDRFVKTHPERVEVTPMDRIGVKRAGPRCMCLMGDANVGYTCDVYAQRPQTCRDFTQGSGNCLFARRRVGLTP